MIPSRRVVMLASLAPFSFTVQLARQRTSLVPTLTDRICLAEPLCARIRFMTKALGLGVLLVSDIFASAGSPLEAQISDGPLRARLSLPDASAVFYRGTRFDWSGVIRSLEYAGHNYYAQWYQRSDPNVHDFIYEGSDIVAGSCTAITGPAEEFVSQGRALGFDQAKPGASFVKIGVGVLRKPDGKKYDPYRLYPIQDGGKWTVTTTKRTKTEKRLPQSLN